MYDMRKIGAIMTWEEVVAEFPDKWVIMADCEYKKGYVIVRGTLVSVFDDTSYYEEYIKAMTGYGGHDRIISRRTTAVYGQRW